MKPGFTALIVSLIGFLSMALYFSFLFSNYYPIVIMSVLFFLSPFALILGTILSIKDLFSISPKLFPIIGLMLDVLAAIGWGLYVVIMLKIG